MPPLSLADNEVVPQPDVSNTTTASVTMSSASETAPRAQTEAELDKKIVVKTAVRRRLSQRHASKTYKFRIADLKGYFTVGEYDDGTPGELFISVSKQGSTLWGLMDSFAIAVSHGLQYGVPLKSYVRTLTSMSFAPAGITNDSEIRTASSVTDYIVRRLALDYLSFDDRLELGLASFDDMPIEQTTLLTDDQTVDGQLVEASEQPVATHQAPAIKPAPDSAAPLCYNCGNQTQRVSGCYVCGACGSTTGCS